MAVKSEAAKERRRIYQLQFRRDWRKRHPDYDHKAHYRHHGESQRDYQKRKRLALRAEIIEAYGSKCACCAENNSWFLTIDHINNDGCEHRKQIAGKMSLYKWLKVHGFPKDRFQLLCWNCNCAKAYFGKCPHQGHVDPMKTSAKWTGKNRWLKKTVKTLSQMEFIKNV